MGYGDQALLRLGRLVKYKRDEAERYSIGGREHGLRDALIPPLALHRQRDEGVRGLLLDKLIESSLHLRRGP